MNPHGPFVSVAALCESILHEKDERISCIRFLDRLEIGVPEDAPAELFPLNLQLNCFISFKSGDFVGKKTVTIKLNHPKGKIAKSPDRGDPAPSFPMEFLGGEHGHNLILKLQAAVDQSGLFIFDVLLDEDLMTRIPLRVVITRIPQNPPEPQNSPTA